MSLHADRVSDSDSGADGLAALVARAGGAVSRPGGEAADFGSAAGELAALMSCVGLADRSQLALIMLQGRPQIVDAVVSDLCGGVDAPAPGGAVISGETWWCAIAPGQVLAVGGEAGAMLLRGRLDWHLARRPELEVRDLAADWTALQLAGSRAGELLGTLGVHGPDTDPRRVAPVHTHPVAGASALWLLRSDHDALAIVARDDAPRVWRAVCEAGRPLRLSVVGHDAVTRYALAQRRAWR